MCLKLLSIISSYCKVVLLESLTAEIFFLPPEGAGEGLCCQEREQVD